MANSGELPLSCRKSQQAQDIEFSADGWLYIASREGNITAININTGDQKVGKDLHEEVPNDPKIKPKDSVRIISTTESQPRNLEGQLTKNLFYRYDNTDAKRPKVVFFRRPGAKSKR